MDGSSFVLRAGSSPRLRSCGSGSSVHSSASVSLSSRLGNSLLEDSSSSRAASQQSLSCSPEALQHSSSCLFTWHSYVADSTLPLYDPGATALLVQRVSDFLATR